jgi:hypothetical protein
MTLESGSAVYEKFIMRFIQESCLLTEKNLEFENICQVDRLGIEVRISVTID